MGRKKIVRIFVSYAQKGPDWGINEIDGILYKFKKRRQDLPCEIHYYWDNFLEAGRKFTPEIEKELRNADIVLLLITRKFFASDYIHEHEKPIIRNLWRKGKSIIPIIIGATSYKSEWVYSLGVKTLPAGIDVVIFNSRQRDTLWSLVEQGLEDAIRKTVERNRRIIPIPTLNENPGCYKWGVISAISMFFLFMVLQPSSTLATSGDNEEEENSITDIARPKPPPTTKNNQIRDNVDEYDNDDSIRKRKNIIPANKRKKKRKLEPELEEILKFYEKNDVQKIPRPLGGGYYGKEVYGRYESCQAINEDGYKPCKKDRRWYLVNESKNIHHMIAFPVSLHEKIYAIRPYYDDFAEVFFHNGDEMYLDFCVDLQDLPANCLVPYSD